ncbi:LacI family transcriptional regulator [Halobacillus andaensis]|uniref:LacI family transcriptional regulator n=1 Tax=Halobacillus andaensis TaxID=1176239 RepID=A0A917BAL6_HALAA|nr:LacI family DNA-binding transcriptional regulator [Halobacillus andaensis]MBP2006545.1 LacI family transcriptional regulator [Halobacillus andaensis]GGF28203.1 LacI family transcriptional regulator [Halobacillus andaensis]
MAYTIRDVAKKANVSTATVSRILNDLGGYSDKTKMKVLDVIQELEYFPSGIARGLTNNRTHTIGVLVPNLTSSLIAEFLTGIESVAHKVGSSIIVCHTESQGIKTMKYLQLLHEKRIDGLIIASTVLKEEYYDYIVKMNVPLVLLSAYSEFPVPYVIANDHQAAYSATKHLIQNGHSKLGMISGNKEEWIAGNTIPRVEGFKRALSDFNIPIDDRCIEYGRFSIEDGVNSLRKLLDRNPDVTAIFAENDEIGIGVLSAAFELGISVPKDISVIGMDDINLCKFMNPPLSSISLSHHEMAEKAAGMIFKMIESGSKVENSILGHQLVERQSVRSH